MTEPAGGVRPPVALALSLVGFFAVAVFGLGMSSLLLDADVIAIEGLGQVPGVVGMLVASASFAGVLWWGLRDGHPTFWIAPIVAVATWLGEGAGVLLGAVVSGAGPATAVAAAGGVLLGFAGAVIAASALAAAVCGVGLVRTRSSRPRWPWERDD
jgi:hypothetical protein